MYAIIRTGGKQYRVEPGNLLRVELLDKKLGSEFDISDVLFVGGDTPKFGTPTVSGAKVSVVVTQQDLGPKILIFKKKRRKGYRRLNGHRQPFTELFIKAISVGGESAKADGKPHVIDPVKQAEKKAELAKKMAGKPKEARQATKKAVTKKAAAPKKAAKKPAKKKVAKKPSKAKKSKA